MTLFYVDVNGEAGTELALHSGHYGESFILITATGTTRDMVDWQMVGVMECYGQEHKTIGLVWDESRILTDYDGVGMLSANEKAALYDAGFNLYNFGG